MNNQLVALSPIISALITATLCILSWRRPVYQKILHTLGAFAFLSTTCLIIVCVHRHDFLVVQMGNYVAPFGISVVIDHFGALMLLITGVMVAAVGVYALGDIGSQERSEWFYPMFWILVLGISGAFSTGDLFNLYVWFEVMLIASFVLMVLGNKKKQLEGTIKYVALNLIATILMLVAISFLYGITGTLNMADIAQHLKQIDQATSIAWIIIMLLALAFSIKSALFPLFFWLPASYHTTSVSASAIFAGMLTKVGVYALIRLFTLIYIPGHAHGILFLFICASGLTMLTGVLGAASQFNFRRILSFLIISQVGYMIAGLAIYTPLALAGTIFYIIHHIIAESNLFLMSGVVNRLYGSFYLKKLGNAYKQHPYLAILFLIPALSLAGVPPLSGFWAKLFIIKAALESYHYVLLSIALFVSLMTLYTMIKIWSTVFLTENSYPVQKKFILKDKITMILPVIALSLLTLFISIFPGFLYREAKTTANQLMHQSDYIHAVLGEVMLSKSQLLVR